jgi:Tfp pilus assembly protein PilF
MKTFVPLLLAAALCLTARAQTPAPAAAPAPDPKLVAIIQEVQKLMASQHPAEALQKLDEAAAIAPNNPLIHNIRGSIYTSPPLRDFAKALESFQAAEKLAPEAFEPKFNMTELLYVQGKYAEAEATFEKLMTKFPKLREDVRHLIQFKIVVCRLKQNKLDEATKGMGAFSFMDDTPAYYFSKAAFGFQKDDKAAAAEWVSKAQRIFKEKENAVYLDTLMEAHWLPSLNVTETKP